MGETKVSKTVTLNNDTVTRVTEYIEKNGKVAKDFSSVVDYFINKGMDVEDR